VALQKNDVPKVKNCINQRQKFGGPCISKKTKCRTLSIRIGCAFCYNFDLAFILKLMRGARGGNRQKDETVEKQNLW